MDSILPPALPIAGNRASPRTCLRRSWVCLSNLLDSLFITNIHDLENVLALEPRLIEPRWLLYCDFKPNDVFVEGDSGEIINPDDQLYTKSHTNGVNKSEHDFYTAVPTINERFGMHGIRIFKDSGNTPELVHKAQLYTNSHDNRLNKSEYNFDTAVLTLTECFGIRGIRVSKDSGNTPELAYRALLRQVAIALTDSGYVAMLWYRGSKAGSMT
jgi:hypothetical protein